MPYPARAVAERRIAEHFLAADAVRPADAIAFETKWPVRARAFARLKDRDILKPAGQGFYLDVAAWSERRASRRKRAAVFLAAVAVVGGIFAAL